MLTAMPYRHTHRGPVTGDPLPRGLLAGLQHDVMAEGCTLVLVDQPGRYQQLSALVTAADLDERLARGEIDTEEYRRLQEVLDGGAGRSPAGTAV